MTHNLECPKCGYKFKVKDDYEAELCPNCNKAFYYWDSVYDEEDGMEYFEGYYWDINRED